MTPDLSYDYLYRTEREKKRARIIHGMGEKNKKKKKTKQNKKQKHRAMICPRLEFSYSFCSSIIVTCLYVAGKRVTLA